MFIWPYVDGKDFCFFFFVLLVTETFIKKTREAAMEKIVNWEKPAICKVQCLRHETLALPWLDYKNLTNS